MILKGLSTALVAVLSLALATVMAPAADAALHPVVAPGDVRISGSDRYATSAAISRTIATPDAGGGTVYIASANDFPDALAVGPVAARSGAPVLLVGRDRVPDLIAEEIRRLAPARIVVVGGPAAVSDSVESALGAIGGSGAVVQRVGGPNRYGTAALLDRDGSHHEVYLTSGEGFADALATGPAAVESQAGLLLTARAFLPHATADALVRMSPSRVTLVGGTHAVSDHVAAEVSALLPGAHVTRIAGATRYETAAMVATHTWPSGSPTVFIASGLQAPDALAGTPAAAASRAPIILGRPECHPAETTALLASWEPERRVHLGGESAIHLGSTTCGRPPAPIPVPTPTPPPAPLEPTAAQLARGFDVVPSSAQSRNALEGLAVRAPASMAGYDRALFPHWRDATAWGWPPVPNSKCDVREATLFRDGSDVTYTSDCAIESGTWLDPYTGVTLYHRSDVDIDHIVPLAEAWRSGAQGWDLTLRTRFANDALGLAAVDDGANAAKGDKTPDRWKPPNKAVHCLYAQRWVAAKNTYDLSVTPAEKQALNSMLDTCTH